MMTYKVYVITEKNFRRVRGKICYYCGRSFRVNEQVIPGRHGKVCHKICRQKSEV